MILKEIRKLRNAGLHEEAYERIVVELENSPNNLQLRFEAACISDYLGREVDAIPHYCACIEAGLAPEQLRKAYIGLGSTYRVLGQYENSERILREGLKRFPYANELKVFLSMTLYNRQKFKESTEILLGVAAKTSHDKSVRRYKRAICFYAKDLDKTWANED